MKRLGIGLAGVALFIALLPTQVQAGAVIGPAVSVVHGIGTTPDTNFADVYIRESGASDFALVVAGNDEDFGFSATFDAGNLPPGDYDVLVCDAAAAPAETITGCADNGTSAVNGNSGNPVTVPNTAQVVLFLGWGDQGRPAVLAFTIDVACVDAGQGRATAAHAAVAGSVTVSDPGGATLLSGLTHGQTATINVPAGSYPVNIHDDQVLDIDATITVGALQNTVTYLTGNPIQSKVSYELITQTFPLEQCVAPSSSTTSTTQAVQATTQPRFTG